MPHYKNSNNEIFFLDSDNDRHFIPQSCVSISDEEANTILATKKETLLNSLTYDQKRAFEYPPMADYLDGVVKGDQDQIQKYINDCLAVKAKYPKQ
jgi:hypothetical protein